ncbi:hypothetical protein ED28_08255 [[Pantoea] beijingensis]|uniref:DUF2231 domain-containing protein n=1 Tax=[Pantoea] beijingensis TaxID=1324864 RepID=A0A443IE76_9GAMM|nr:MULTISPECIES: DUF2231 domain-containing protein [Erwiniaceae]RWR02363.1 hypothetical protein ED28_08255 [[Pantoea] beijingensis]
MQSNGNRRHSTLAVALYELLNPIYLGFFVAAWIFDIIYLNSTEVYWTQASSWLIALGLFIAIIPRLINLVQVWVGVSYPQGSAIKMHFWLNLIAIVLSIFNAFIHSRDVWAVVPAGVTLSTIVVALLLIANLQLALRDRTA